MTRKEVFQGIITTMQRELPFPVLERDLELPINSGQIITVTGVRRCGKSSMMKIAANKVYNSGIDRENILWINFDDERLDGMTHEELDEIIQAYREMFPERDLSEVYIFFDEIQIVPKWELFVLRLYKTYTKNIFISGSNAKMLSSQLSTALRGWPIEFQAYPLSFDEYLRFRQANASQFDEAGRGRLINMCREYIHTSSFPEIVLMNEESLRIRKVQGYFNTMLFRDLIEHYSLSSPEIIRYLLKRMLLNLTKPTSINNIYNDLKSQGRKVDKNKLYDLAQWSCDTFMFYSVNRWSPSLIKENARTPKYYFTDNGMRNAVILPQSNDDGKLLENAVFLNLKRHSDSFRKITYFADKQECDFVIQRDEYIEMLIQVSWTISDPETFNREIKGLRAASMATKCTNCFIVTFDEERTIEAEGLTISVVPAWKWLRENPFKPTN